MATEVKRWADELSVANTLAMHDSWLVSWGRRALTIPLYALLLVVAVVSSPLCLMVAAIVDLLRGRSFVVVRCMAFFTWYLACEVVGISVSFAVWLASLLSARRDPELFVERNFRLQCWWARTLLAGATYVFGLRFEADVPEGVGNGPLLLFVRHTSVGDTLLPAVYLSNRFGLMLRYVLKRELLWDPCLDIVGNRLPNYFARRGSGESDREIRAVQGLLEGLGAGDGVLIYPEGTRFTAAKRRRALERIAKGRHPELLAAAERLRHVLPPRLGGPLGLLERNPGADVVLCAHTGFEGAGTFSNLLRGHLVNATIRVRFWRVPYADIPRERTAQVAWLFDQWRQVDDWVAHNASPRVLGEADA